MAYESALAALADPTRRAVLERVVGGPRCVADIAKNLPVSRPAVSQHLKVLREAGLVCEHREGTRRVYAADPAALGELRAYVESMWQRALEQFGAAVQPSEENPDERRRSVQRAARGQDDPRPLHARGRVPRLR